MKKYEDKVSISLVKGTHDIPTIKNDVLSVANENHYSFDVSSSYIFSNKGSKRDDCPLIFVTYHLGVKLTTSLYEYNSYIITGRIKNGGRSGSELPIWQKFRFDVWNNIDKWIEEYG